MGTRSTVKFYESYPDEGKNDLIASVYQQYDGYFEGVGLDLVNFLLSRRYTNGLNAETGYTLKTANGPGCLAASYIATHKTEAGDVYMTTSDDTQEYNYRVYFDMKNYLSDITDPDELISVEVRDWNNCILFPAGTPSELRRFITVEIPNRDYEELYGNEN